MTILYFSKASNIGPSSRYRIYQYLPCLASLGIRVSVKPLFGPTYFRLLSWRNAWLRNLVRSIYVLGRFCGRLSELFSIKRTDLIVVEGQLFPYMGVAFERMLAKRYTLIVELDDAIYLTHGHERKMPALLQLSSGAIVGNRTLAEYARTYTPNVYVVPTVVDTNRFKPSESRSVPREYSADEVITIVWMGLDYNVAYLEWLIPVFRKIQAVQKLRLRVICGKAPVFDGVDVEFRRWRYETEVDDLQSSDIGIMPLPNNEWAKGKCGLKLLQYMSVGLPAVASPIGVNQEIVENGISGFLASTEEEWYANLIRLCRDVELRARMGREARKTIVKEYSLAAWAPRLAACFQEIVAKPKAVAIKSVVSGTVRP